MHWSAHALVSCTGQLMHHAHCCRLLATAGLMELECCKQFCAAAGKTQETLG